MTTLEMMNEAAKTDKAYTSGEDLTSMRYSPEKGFHDQHGNEWEGYGFEFVNNIFSLDNWKELKPIKMTRKQIVEVLGYEIELAYEKINPFYDSNILVSYRGKEEKRMLVELFPDELEKLISQSQFLLRTVFGK